MNYPQRVRDITCNCHIGILIDPEDYIHRPDCNKTVQEITDLITEAQIAELDIMEYALTNSTPIGQGIKAIFRNRRAELKPKTGGQ